MTENPLFSPQDEKLLITKLLCRVYRLLYLLKQTDPGLSAYNTKLLNERAFPKIPPLPFQVLLPCNFIQFNITHFAGVTLLSAVPKTRSMTTIVPDKPFVLVHGVFVLQGHRPIEDYATPVDKKVVKVFEQG
jgi:hypothetical protein